MNIKFFLKLIILFSGIIIFSCTSGEPIFNSVSIEEKLIDGTLNNNITVSNFAEDSDGNLWTAAGKIYKKPAASSEWLSFPLPSGYNFASDLAVLNDYIFAVVFNTKTNPFNTTLFMYDQLDGSWSLVADADFTTSRISSIESVNGTLFVLERIADNNYTLFSSSDGTAYTEELTALTSGRLNITYDGADYRLANGNKTWGGSLTSMADDSPASVTGTFSSIISTPGFDAEVLASTDSGQIWYYLSGSWTMLTDTSTVRSLFEYSDSLILAGTDTGYSELSFTAAGNIAGGFTLKTTPVQTAPISFSTIDLSRYPVYIFYRKGTALYAGTYGLGLWKNDGSSWSIE
jgi:hypothetical protein